MKDLAGKKILFVSPKYFSYELEIKNKLEQFGAVVDYFDERPSNKTHVKAAIRLNRFIIKNLIHEYYETIIETNKVKKYDYVFFIQIETPFPEIFKKLRDSNPYAKYILYMWDSIMHRPKIIELSKYFDLVYTYDRQDSIKYNLLFRPLFFLNDYSNIDDLSSCYDISFIGTIHSDRYSIIKKIKNQVDDYGLNAKWHLYVHNQLMFYKHKLSGFQNFLAKKDEFVFNPLNKRDIIKILSQSKVILDIQHPDNDGLTMRTLETVGLKKKLITTNNDIVNYDFYNPSNVSIINRYDPVIDRSFFDTDYLPLQDKIYNRYSIDAWITDIFNSKTLV